LPLTCRGWGSVLAISSQRVPEVQSAVVVLGVAMVQGLKVILHPRHPWLLGGPLGGVLGGVR
jgi:hypothetical protein